MDDKIELKRIEKYIETYSSNYSDDAIKNQLKNTGYKQEDIDLVYSNLNKNDVKFEQNKKDLRKQNKYSINDNQQGEPRSGLALGLVIAGFFIPLLGIILEIFGLILAFKARKINRDDNVALAAIILGCIFMIILGIILFFILFMVFGFLGYVF